MNILTSGLVLVCALWSGLAVAQWQWIDQDGRTVFSDRAPPVGVPEKAIVKRPGLPHAVVVQPGNDAQEPARAATTALPASAAASSGVDKALAEKKAKAQAEENAKRQAEEQRLAGLKADNCKRAKASKMGLDSGRRVSRINAKGETEFLDDAARAAETQRLQSIISRDCQ